MKNERKEKEKELEMNKIEIKEIKNKLKDIIERKLEELKKEKPNKDILELFSEKKDYIVKKQEILNHDSSIIEERICALNNQIDLLKKKGFFIF